MGTLHQGINALLVNYSQYPFIPMTDTQALGRVEYATTYTQSHLPHVFRPSARPTI